MGRPHLRLKVLSQILSEHTDISLIPLMKSPTLKEGGWGGDSSEFQQGPWLTPRGQQH